MQNETVASGWLENSGRGSPSPWWVLTQRRWLFCVFCRRLRDPRAGGASALLLTKLTQEMKLFLGKQLVGWIHPFGGVQLR